MQKISQNLDEIKLEISNSFHNCSDLCSKDMTHCGYRLLVCTMDGLIDTIMLSQTVLVPLSNATGDFSSQNELYNSIKENLVHSLSLIETDNYQELFSLLMSGFAIVCVEGCQNAIAVGVQGFSKRSITEPKNEANIKGSKEAFVEVLNDNKALVRRRIKSPHLKMKQFNVGKTVQTSIVLAYMDDRVNKKYALKIERKIKNANIDTLVDMGVVSSLIDTNIASFFSAVGNTERPDTFASKLMEGRVGIIIDGTPFALYTPYLFSDNFSALDDYDNPPFYSSFMRALRYFSFGISLLLPGIYVAVGTFHQELIPTTLLYIVATSEATTPFPLTVEAIFIHILYEIMREAGLRLPSSIGHAVSIIGAIVIGDATVSAGLIGAPMLVVVAVTAISSYVVYPLYESVAVLRIAFIIIGGLTGMYGLMLAFGMLLLNICVINPFGVPYSAPITPLTAKSLGDTLFFQGWRSLRRRKVRVSDLEGSSVE